MGVCRCVGAGAHGRGLLFLGGVLHGRHVHAAPDRAAQLSGHLYARFVPAVRGAALCLPLRAPHARRAAQSGRQAHHACRRRSGRRHRAARVSDQPALGEQGRVHHRRCAGEIRQLSARREDRRRPERHPRHGGKVRCRRDRSGHSVGAPAGEAPDPQLLPRDVLHAAHAARHLPARQRRGAHRADPRGGY